MSRPPRALRCSIIARWLDTPTSMDTMVDVSLGRRYKPLQAARTQLKIPHACRVFVEGIIAEAVVKAASDHHFVDRRVIDWDSIWHAGDGASSTEQALGRIVTAAPGGGRSTRPRHSRPTRGPRPHYPAANETRARPIGGATSGHQATRTTPGPGA